MDEVHASHRLFRELKQQVTHYPSGVCEVRRQIQGTSFFPGGIGLWREPVRPTLPAFPVGGVMIVGQDFDSESGYNKSAQRGHESTVSPTWKNLLEFLEKIPICRRQCFFTNAFMGLRVQGRNTGRFPGQNDAQFVQGCRRFFLRQFELQQPSLLISLGRYVPRFLGSLSSQLRPWEDFAGFPQFDRGRLAVRTEVQFEDVRHRCVVAALVHPSMRKSNVRHRQWDGLEGHEAEVALTRHAATSAGLPNVGVD